MQQILNNYVLSNINRNLSFNLISFKRLIFRQINIKNKTNYNKKLYILVSITNFFKVNETVSFSKDAIEIFYRIFLAYDSLNF